MLRSLIWSLCSVSLAFAAASADSAHAKKFRVLYAFTGGAQGDSPAAGVIRDKQGNLYGTTTEGGENPGFGLVYKLARDGSYTVLYAFNDYRNGDMPEAALYRDPANGDLYGTTYYGGIHNEGTIFKVAADGTETVLHNFGDITGDGAYPQSGLIRDGQGNFYGATTSGGGGKAPGAIYNLTAAGSYSVLYSFGKGDGNFPQSGLAMDSAGNLYGTAFSGGKYDKGTLFKLAPDGRFTVLHSFASGTDGDSPAAGVVLDASGNIYGTAAFGGGGNCNGNYCGVVYRMGSDGTYSILHAFQGGNDGCDPRGSLLLGRSGLLYGTTAVCGGDAGGGTVFSMTLDGKEKILHRFVPSEGTLPEGGVIEDKRGRFYGTTGYDGNGGGSGTVYELKE